MSVISSMIEFIDIFIKDNPFLISFNINCRTMGIILASTRSSIASIISGVNWMVPKLSLSSFMKLRSLMVWSINLGGVRIGERVDVDGTPINSSYGSLIDAVIVMLSSEWVRSRFWRWTLERVFWISAFDIWEVGVRSEENREQQRSPMQNKNNLIDWLTRCVHYLMILHVRFADNWWRDTQITLLCVCNNFAESMMIDLIRWCSEIYVDIMTPKFHTVISFGTRNNFRFYCDVVL